MELDCGSILEGTELDFGSILKACLGVVWRILGGFENFRVLLEQLGPLEQPGLLERQGLLKQLGGQEEQLTLKQES